MIIRTSYYAFLTIKLHKQSSVRILKCLFRINVCQKILSASYAYFKTKDIDENVRVATKGGFASPQDVGSLAAARKWLGNCPIMLANRELHSNYFFACNFPRLVNAGEWLKSVSTHWAWRYCDATNGAIYRIIWKSYKDLQGSPRVYCFLDRK